MAVRTIDLPDLAATEAFGRRLGSLLFPGAVVALIGPLGAGKTHLARAVAAGLGVPDPRVVTSPTFVLIQEYAGRLPVYHFDAYRLRGESDLSELGVHEYFEGDGVCLVEWADRAAGGCRRSSCAWSWRSSGRRLGERRCSESVNAMRRWCGRWGEAEVRRPGGEG